MMKRFTGCVVLVLGILGFALPGHAQVRPTDTLESTENYEKQGPSTFTFLKVTPTARAASMGDAYTSVAEGIEAIYWNAAGIAKVPRLGYSFGYIQWLADTKFYSGAVAANMRWSTVVGLSVVTFQTPEIIETTTLQPTGTGNMVNTGDTAIGLSVARQMTNKLSAGLTLRYIQSTLGAEKLQALSLSVGTLLHTGFKSFRIGMSMKNLGGEQQIVTEKSSMPTVFHVGGSMEVLGELGDPYSLTGSLEGAYFTDRWQRYNLGAELWVMNTVALRAGYKFRYDEESWSVGAGLKGTFSGRTIHVDVSYSDFGPLLNTPLRLSLSGTF